MMAQNSKLFHKLWKHKSLEAHKRLWTVTKDQGRREYCSRGDQRQISGRLWVNLGRLGCRPEDILFKSSN